MGADWLGDLLRLAPEARHDWYASLSKADAHAIARYWPLWARAEQMPPTDEWRTWLICAGRGFGKTRAGAEWVRTIARSDPEARIALVGASLGEVQAQGEWAGHEGALAFRVAGSWMYAPPSEGTVVFDRALGGLRHWRDGWQAMALPAIPTGGATIDTEARAAIEVLIAQLRAFGLGV